MLGHLLLLELLLEEQQRRRAQQRDCSSCSTEARVVLVSSMTHFDGQLELADLQWACRPYDPYRAYATSKMQLVMLAEALQRRLDR